MRASAVVLLAALVPAAARAQTAPGGDIDLQAFRPAVDSRGHVTVNASQVLAHGDMSFGLVTTWGHRLLAIDEPGMTVTVEDMVTPTLQGAFGLWGFMELGVSVPFHIVDGEGVSAQGVGDPSIHAKVRLLDTSRYPAGLALLGSFQTESGLGEESWMSAGQPVVTAQAIVDKDFLRGRLRLAANGGFRARDPRAFTMGATTIRAGNELPFGLAASYALVKQRFDLTTEVFGAVPLDADHYFPLEAAAGLKVYLAKSSFFTAGAGLGLVPDAAANPDFRAYMGIVFEPSIGDRDDDGLKDDVDRCPDLAEDADDFEDRDGCPEPDNDHDQLVDLDDACPNEPEDRDAIDDGDGCPESDSLDRDGDRIADTADECPDDPEDLDGWLDPDGCPDPDNDSDQILDIDDLCLNDAEDHDSFKDQDGCPDPDNDQDRIADTADSCRNEKETWNGYQDTDGCPDHTGTTVTTTGIEILDKIYFETDKATILPDSYPILDAVAATILANPELELLEVQGHADERGSDQHNLELTQARAESVRDYLVKAGVEKKRLRPKGYGETAPLDDSHTPEAWSTNRRVEFVIR